MFTPCAATRAGSRESSPAPPVRRAPLERKTPKEKLLRVLGQRHHAAVFCNAPVLLAVMLLFVMMRDLADVYDREQHEYEGLHERNEDAQGHDERGQNPPYKTGDCAENLFVAEEVSEETYAERERAH